SNYPLRALLSNRQDAPQTTVTLSALPSIAAFLSVYADSLAQHPWLEIFPAAIQSLIPVQYGEQRLVCDAAGQQLLLHPQFRDYWQLLAISGGHPLTVFGEWDGRYLRPLSVWQDNHAVFSERLFPIMQLWQDLLATALLGTAQQSLTLPGAAGDLGKALKQIDWDNQEQALLSAAGLVALWRRAGQLPCTDQVSLPTVCGADAQPGCNETAAGHLELMLQGHYSKVLPEWLTALTQAGKQAPARCLPELLEAGRIRSGLRDLIVPVLGQRGRWLAEHNPDWHYAIEHNDESIWETGTREQRLTFLRGMRQQTPARARELLSAHWSRESAKERAAFSWRFNHALGHDGRTVS
ncbi:MAG: hypothetical protein HC808_15355, partial [Candidatus Competibacteraceae bacterium]|nr:hypothetical protein [Candidatus Competibacteraceae bacterium]